MAVAAASPMRGFVLLALAGCLVTTEGPLVTSSSPIIAIAADDIGVVWAAQGPGRSVNVWALERGALVYKLGTVESLDRLALVRHHAYWSAGTAQQIVGAQGKFLLVRGGGSLQAYDPGFDAPDHDGWRHTYPAADWASVGAGHGRVAIGSPPLAHTFELGAAGSDVHDVGAHAPTLVRPLAGGVAFAAADGLFIARHRQIEQVADAASWAHIVEVDGVLWAATAADDEPSRLVRIENGTTTVIEPEGGVTALTLGGGRVYYATPYAIYHAN